MPWFAGISREEIKWYPTIDSTKCVKCGICMNCGKEVYDWTENGPVVARPYSCVVGCTTCANLCLGNAITFPDINELKEFYKKHNIWSKVKKVLEEEKKLTIK